MYVQCCDESLNEAFEELDVSLHMKCKTMKLWPRRSTPPASWSSEESPEAGRPTAQSWGLMHEMVALLKVVLNDMQADYVVVAYECRQIVAPQDWMALPEI